MIVGEFRQLLTGLPWTLALMSATFVVGALLGLPLVQFQILVQLPNLRRGW